MTRKTMVNYESYSDSLIQLLPRQCVDRSPAEEKNPAKSPTRITGHDVWELFAPSITTGIPRPCRISHEPGLYPQIHACASEPRSGEERHPGLLRAEMAGFDLAVSCEMKW